MLGSSRTFSRSAASATWQAQARAAPVGDVLRGAIAGKGDERARQRLRRRLRQLVHHIQPALVRAHVLRRISANYEVSAPVWNVFVHIAASPGSTWHLHNCRCDSQVESGGHCRTLKLATAARSARSVMQGLDNAQQGPAVCSKPWRRTARVLCSGRPPSGRCSRQPMTSPSL